MVPAEAQVPKGSDFAAAQLPVQMELLILAAEIVQLLGVGLVLDWLLFGGVAVVGLIRLGVVSAVLVGMLKSQGWLVLLAVQVSLFSREPGRPEMIIGIVPWLFGLASICIVAYAYLGKPFRTSVSRWMATQLLFAIGLGDPTAATNSMPQTSKSNWVRFVTMQLLMWMVVIFVAMLALSRLPISVAVRSEWLRSAIENDFIVWPGASLLAITLLLVIVFREAAWRQMTGAQARLYLRTSFVLDHYRDLRMIVMRQLKKNKKLANNNIPQKQLVERAETRL
jgi:hypothetical protein